MYIAILGRQPEIGIAELERRYGNVKRFSQYTALVDAPTIAIDHLGGSQKIGRVVQTSATFSLQTAQKHALAYYSEHIAPQPGKVTLGISVYDATNISSRQVQKIGLTVKQAAKKNGNSLRLIPNTDADLSTATSHHNKLGKNPNKIELFIIKGFDGSLVIAESTGTQNITQYAKRDRNRPKRDAFVGMLPPKLAQMMINLTGEHASHDLVLDPFCGTGVVLQEALLMGYDAAGSDLNPKMIDYTGENISWLKAQYSDLRGLMRSIETGDAMSHTWEFASDITAIACEAYLGQPFSAPPSPAKLREVRGNCNHIIGTFLKNISNQVPKGTPVCIAVPAWKDSSGSFTHLPLTERPQEYGITPYSFSAIRQPRLLYHRENQVVARELIVGYTS